jgi:hypothetical protein
MRLLKLLWPFTADRRAFDLRNRALEIAMDWDSDWHGPLGPKLRKEVPKADPQDIERVAAECAEAIEFGHGLAHSLSKTPASSTVVWEDLFRETFNARYPWASPENTYLLFRQGLYYASKTGTRNGSL